jgi:hypothetical protein
MEDNFRYSISNNNKISHFWINMPRLNNFSKSTGSAKGSDEQYTPKILSDVIIPYLSQFNTIWCPFDTDNSEFVIGLREAGHTVIATHIIDGYDFFTYEPDIPYDAIVSNPPFSKKMKVFERLYNINKPFALLMGLPILNYQIVGSFFINKPLQLLIVDKKVSYNGKTSSFNCSYFCNNILPRDLMFTSIKHNNTGSNFIKSRMTLNII